jgi:nucleoside phosphorylase
VRILVTFAVDAEFAPWRKRHKFQRDRVGNMTFYRDLIAGIETDVLLTGIGKKNASGALTFLMMQTTGKSREYDVCVSAGLAGALRKGHSIGEILAAPRVINEKEVAERSNKSGISANGALLQWAGECGATAAGPFLTVDRLVATAAEKERLSEYAEAVEMESSEVLLGACVWGIRGIAIRAISDLENEDVPLDLTSAVSDEGTVRKGKVLRQVSRRPNAIPGLIRLAWNSNRSARALASFLDRYLVKMSEFRLQVDGWRKATEAAGVAR